MRSCIIAQSDSFTVISYGNGTAYDLQNTADGMSVYFQGDDADDFRTSWDKMEDSHPDASAKYILGTIWDWYADVAQPIEA